MSSRYFWAWVTAWIGLVAAPSSSALTVMIDGVKHTGSTVTITSGSTGGGGTTDPVPGNNGGGGNPPPGGDNSNTGNTPPPADGSVCSGDLKLYQTALPNGSGRYSFKGGEAYAFGFQLSPGERKLISYEKGKKDKPKLVTISTCPGNFNIKSISGNCYQKGSNAGGFYVDGGGASRFFYCSLNPNQTYYFNIRSYNTSTGQDSCGTDETCGFTLSTH